MRWLITASVLALGLPAQAQAISCADRDAVVGKLSRLGEAQAGYGLSRGGQVFEIWASERTGSWTIVLSRSDGSACIMSYGQNWTAPELMAGAPA